MRLKKEIRHFHLFCGLGGGAAGFNRGEARVGNVEAKFRCLGGVDVDAAGIRDFNKLTGVRGTVLDMFDRDQYRDFHGVEPPSGWREATPADIQRAAGNERPHIVFLSAPCKGFSGLLSEGKSKTVKYQALNRLTLRGVFLMLEAFADDLPELVIFENVPRIASRGRHLLDQIVGLLRQYGYAVAETTHDCGEIGGLAQSRKRFLLVARNVAKVPHFLYEPMKRPLQSVGSILGRMPLPGDPQGGPMHRIPALQWKTWVRLAFVEAGSDWRSLNKLAVEDGVLRDFLIVPEMRGGVLGVRDWNESTGVVAGRSMPSNGAFSVADPRYNGQEYSQYGVLDFDAPMGAVSGQSAPGGGKYTVADPRLQVKHNNCFRVVRFDQKSGTVTGGTGPSSGGQGVADPRMPPSDNRHYNLYRVIPWDKAANVVAGSSHVGGGALSVADPRGGENPGELHGKYPITGWDTSARTVIGGNCNGAYAVADPRSHTGFGGKGKYIVTPYDSPANTVISGSTTGQGAFAVADKRAPVPTEELSACLPAADQKTVAIIRAMDGTWHRPFTTLELAALQGLIDPEEQLELDGLSDQAWRERIGNAVPAPAAQAIASEMGRTLLLAWTGGTLPLALTPIWVRPVAVALTVAQGGPEYPLGPAA